MTREQLIATIAETERFLSVARACLESGTRDQWRHFELTGSKHTGATKRASLDLTRQLARLRGAR
jgi:hypothetical protein